MNQPTSSPPPTTTEPPDWGLGPPVRVVSTTQLAYAKKETFRNPELQAIFTQTKECFSTLAQAYGNLPTIDLFPPTVRLTQSILVRSLSLNSGSSSSGTAPTVGEVRMKDGVLQEFRPGPSGENRWQSTNQKDTVGGTTQSEDAGKGKPTPAQKQEKSDAQEAMSESQQAEFDRQFKNIEFKEQTVELKRKDGSKEEVDGHAVGGLLVHLDATPGIKKWVVSHIKSGAQVVGAITDEKVARMTAARLSQDFNFERSIEDLFKDPLYNLVGNYALRLKANPYSLPPSQMAREKAQEHLENEQKKEAQEAKTKENVDSGKESEKQKEKEQREKTSLKKSIEHPMLLRSLLQSVTPLVVDESCFIGHLLSSAYNRMVLQLEELTDTTGRVDRSVCSRVCKDHCEVVRSTWGDCPHALPVDDFVENYVWNKLVTEGVIHFDTHSH